jgi:hypothetical protein
VSGCVLKACRLYARFNFRSSFASARDRPNTLAAFEFPSLVRISFFIIVTLFLLPLVLLIEYDETETETPNVVVLWPRPDGGNFPNEHFPKNPPPPFEEEEEEQHAKAVLVVALVLPKVAAQVKAAAPPTTTTETIVLKALLSFLHYSAKENQK